jgi:hypothetical protein
MNHVWPAATRRRHQTINPAPSAATATPTTTHTTAPPDDDLPARPTYAALEFDVVPDGSPAPGCVDEADPLPDDWLAGWVVEVLAPEATLVPPVAAALGRVSEAVAEPLVQTTLPPRTTLQASPVTLMSVAA